MSVVVRALLAVAVLAAFALGTGCGSDVDASKYVEQVNVVQTSFAKALARTQTEITPTSSAVAGRKTIDKFETTVTKVVSALRGITPPESVAKLHDQLIHQISEYGTALQGVKQKFASNSPQEILTAQTELTSSVAQISASINQTIDQINTKLHAG